jgi:hypothetical protein
MWARTRQSSADYSVVATRQKLAATNGDLTHRLGEDQDDEA